MKKATIVKSLGLTVVALFAIVQACNRLDL